MDIPPVPGGSPEVLLGDRDRRGAGRFPGSSRHAQAGGGRPDRSRVGPGRAADRAGRAGARPDHRDARGCRRTNYDLARAPVLRAGQELRRSGADADGPLLPCAGGRDGARGGPLGQGRLPGDQALRRGAADRRPGPARSDPAARDLRRLVGGARGAGARAALDRRTAHRAGRDPARDRRGRRPGRAQSEPARRPVPRAQADARPLPDAPGPAECRGRDQSDAQEQGPQALSSRGTAHSLRVSTDLRAGGAGAFRHGARPGSLRISALLRRVRKEAAHGQRQARGSRLPAPAGRRV